MRAKILLGAIIALSVLSLPSYAITTNTILGNPNIAGHDIDSDKYTNRLIYKINHLKKGDVLYIHIDSRGGEESAMLGIAAAIKSAKGEVIGIIDGECASAAANISTVFRHVKIGPKAWILFHSGRCPGQSFATCPHQAFMDRLALSYIKNILTPAEIKHILVDRKEVILTGQEYGKRLKKIGVIVE